MTGPPALHDLRGYTSQPPRYMSQTLSACMFSLSCHPPLTCSSLTCLVLVFMSLMLSAVEMGGVEGRVTLGK